MMAARTCVPLRLLRDTETKPLDAKLVDRAVEILKTDPKAVPPILGIFEKTAAGEVVHVSDGHHRVAAYRVAGLPCAEVINEASMRRSDRAAYTRAVNKYRKLIGHAVKRGG